MNLQVEVTNSLHFYFFQNFNFHDFLWVEFYQFAQRFLKRWFFLCLFDIFLMVSVLAHINEVTMVVKLMTPLLTWPFPLKAFFYYKCIYVLLRSLRFLWNLESFFMFYISNCFQTFIKLSLALNRGFFCKVKVKDERYDNIYMQHGII